MGLHQVLGEEKEYNLKCRVQKIKESYDDLGKGQQETETVLLVPEINGEASRFFNVYLPEAGTVCLDCSEDLRMGTDQCPKCQSFNVKTETTEVGSWIAYPVDGPCRLAVLRKNNYCSKHHLYVMSTGAETDLLKLDGKEVHLTILASKDDDMLDQAKSVNRDIDNKFKDL